MLRLPHLALLVMSIAACIGCATTGVEPFADVSPVASREESATSGQPLSRSTTIAPSHPFKTLLARPSRKSQHSTATVDVAASTVRQNADADRKAAESALTSELIDFELRDAPAAEREELRRELSGLDFDLVRQILRIRRRSLEAQPKQVAQSRSRITKPIPSDTRPTASARTDAEPAASPPVGKHTPPKLGMPTLSGLGIANPFSLTRSKATEGHTPPSAKGGENPAMPDSGVVITAATDAGGSAIQRANFTPPATPGAESANNVGDASAAAVDPSGAAPAGAAATPSWKTSLQNLVALAEVEVQQLQPGTSDIERQKYIDGHVHLRLLYLMSGRPQRALQAIPGLEPAEQEFWQQLLWGIATSLDSQTHPAPADRATHTISQLAAAIQRLQQQAHLEIGNVSFCHKISSFGNYERFAQDEFSPGQPVLIYAEVANFRSEVTPEGLSRTQLSSTIEIVRPGDKEEVLEQIPFPVTEDLCRNQRRDYFHSYEITLPQRLTTGPHVLRLTVEDQLSKKKATTTLNFAVK